MSSAAAQMKTLIVFRNPPRWKEVMQTVTDKTFDMACKTSNEILLQWEGVNYILGEEEKNSCYRTYTNTEKSQEISKYIGSSFPSETSGSSGGVFLDYSFKQSSHSHSRSVDLPEDSCQSFEDINGNRDECYATGSGVSMEEFLDTIEAASLQSELPDVMKVNEETLDRQSFSAEQETISKRNACIDYDYSPNSNRMVALDSPLFHDCHCKSIGKPNRCVDGKVEIEPLCRAGTGKFNILVFILQVIVERTARLRNGNYAQFAALYVADKNSDYVKLTLWNDSKNWIRSIDIGCIVVITDVIQHTWKSSVSVATTFSSHMYDCCHAKNSPSDYLSEVIRKETLSDFITQMKKKYPSIYKSTGHFPSVKKAQNIESFDNLVPGAVVNFVAVVLSISIESAKEKDWFQLPVAKIGLKDKTGRIIRLSIWQNQSSMLSVLRRNHGNWLKFARLAVQTASTGTGLELHSISDTVVDEQPSEYCSQEKRKRTNFEENITGTIISIEFLDKKRNTFALSHKLLIEASSSSSFLLENKTCDDFVCLRDFVYTACLYCFSEIDVLANGEYQGCKRCIKMSWKYNFKYTDILRPFKLKIDRENIDPVTVAVFPNDFNRLKSKAPLKDILKISKSAKESSRIAFDLEESISRIFKPRKFVFYVSREESDGSDSLTREEICLLKDVEEFND